jgi:Phage integrase, N-terminal SAM-like domain
MTSDVRERYEAVCVAEFLDIWLAHVRERVRATTCEGYESLLRCHVPHELGAQPLTDVSPPDLQRMYVELLTGAERPKPLSAGTVLNLHLVLTQAFGQAVRWQLLATNPAAGAQPPRPRRSQPVSVTPELLDRPAAHGAPRTHHFGLGYAVEPPSFWAPFRGIALLDITPPTTTVTYYLSYRASDDSPLVLALVDATTSSGLSGTA